MKGPYERSRRPGRRIVLSVVGWIAALALRVLGATWRIRVEGVNPLAPDTSEDRMARIGALWHRDIVIAAWFFRGSGVRVGVSRSRDGDWISALLLRLGFGQPARGSSSRGGVGALRELARTAAERGTVALIVDGPRGPAGRSKPGVVALARLTGAPIHPIVFSAERAIRFSSWDHTCLPLPFARVVCAFGDPIFAGSELESDAEVSDRLDATLGALADDLDRRVDPSRSGR